jgi:hypothetical protein
MDFNNIDDIKKNGFVGFKTIRELFEKGSQLPAIKGVYLVLYCEKNEPIFCNEGTGGHFRGKTPNVSIDKLNENWVKNTLVIYIGKAGGNGAKPTLKSRLRQYFHFGRGKNVGHWGGRLIWQLKYSDELIVCWKTLQTETPRTVEASLIQEFKNQFEGQRPFANLAD